LIDAGLLHKEEAVREGRRAVELRPVSDDAVEGPAMVAALALIYTWTGDNNAALEQLTFLATHASEVSYGQLKYDPVWDSARQDPRFAPMLKTLEPRIRQ
jgi:hypothetical protein